MLERIGKTELMIAGVVLAVLIVVVVPLAISASKKSQRSEVRLNVDSIRTAQIAHKEAFNEYVSCASAPRAPQSVGATAVAWKPTPGFVKLNWSPEKAEVFGSYTVDATRKGFTVIGTCDIDGDGRRATFKATESQEATRTTDANVF